MYWNQYIVNFPQWKIQVNLELIQLVLQWMKNEFPTMKNLVFSDQIKLIISSVKLVYIRMFSLI